LATRFLNTAVQSRDGRNRGRGPRFRKPLCSTGRLGPERAARLEALAGWSWTPKADSWERNFALLEAFAARERHSRVPSKTTALGQWVSVQRGAFRKGQLPAEKIERLEALPGWSWNVISEQWESSFQLLQAFAKREGHARVPPNTTALGRWVSTQRQEYKKGRLSPEQVERLEGVPGWSWNVISEQWQETFAVLERIVARIGTAAQLPKDYVEDGIRIGQWIGTQRVAWKAGSLPAQQVALLEGLSGWSWEPWSERWERNFALLERFVAREGHAHPPSSQVEDGMRLGMWVENQRGARRQRRLPEARAKRLEALPGWFWNARQRTKR
jgi:hypothetical protein